MDITTTAALSRQACTHEFSHRLRIADDIADQTFLFTLPWDMESTVEPVHFDGPIDWNYQPGADPEWTVMLCRHRYTVCLAQVYAITRQQKYLDAYIDIITSFILHAPQEEGKNGYTWRTIDSGIRCSNWVWSLNILQATSSLPQSFLQLITASLLEHIDYLMGCYDATHLISNWGVLVNTGALSACFYLQNNGYGNYQPSIALLMKRLEEQIHIQVLPDGWQWEQSPMYHHEVLWCYLENILLLTENNQDISPAILDKTKSMCYATLYSSKPNHHQFMRGDSDDTDVRDILTLGAYLFSDGQLKSGGYENLDFDNLWRLGGDKNQQYQRIGRCLPSRLSGAMESSGNYFFRSSWQEDAFMLAFKCGHLGSGHGHGDLLHFDLFANGEDVLIDSGRYTYVDDQDRRYLKSQSAHNTITLDGKHFTDCCASWRYGAVAKPIKGTHYEDEQYYYVCGSHLGYIEEGLFLRRQIVVIKPDIIVVCDSVYGSGNHEVLQKFHFNNSGTLQMTDTHSVTYNSEKNKVQLTVLNKSAQLSIKPARISRSYNTIEPSSCVESQSSIFGSGAVITVISLGNSAGITAEKIPVYQPREKRILDDSRAHAIRLTGAQCCYVVIFSINDPVGGINLLGADTEIGYGEVMVFDQTHHCTTLSY